MAVITISATSLGTEYLAGIPQFVQLETNIPSTIFYTIDGTQPTAYSSVYLTPIEMPTTGTIRLWAYAVSGSDSGTLYITYATDQWALHKFRRDDGYGIGIAIDAYDVEAILYDGYKAGTTGTNININVPARYSDYELEDLEIKYSSTGFDGIGVGTIMHIGPFSQTTIEQSDEIEENASSPNNQNVNFNPKSLYIVIDGRDGYEDQSVHIIPRPLSGTMDPVKYLNGKIMYESSPYVSGGLVKAFKNYSNGVMVSYYFDHNTTRWIKSIQSFDPAAVPKNIGLRSGLGQPLVFKWIYNKRSGI